jgi:preprotein translocase SecE subunit
MAVAVKNSPDVSSPSLFDRTAVVSLVGVVYVVGCLGIVFKLIPTLWWQAWEALGGPPDSFAGGSLLALVLLVSASGLAVLGARLLGPRAPAGARAGIFVGLLGVLAILLLTRWASLWIEHWVYDERWFGPSGVQAGAALTAGVGLALLIVGVRLFLRKDFEGWLVRFEQQGWFHANSFKRLQGLKVRRGTIFGLLLIAGAGIWTLVSHGTLRRAPHDWQLNIPFTGKVILTDYGDAAPAIEERDPNAPRDPAKWVKLQSAGDAEEFKDKVGDSVPRPEFEAVVRRLEAKNARATPGEKVALPEEDTSARLAISRYELRDINETVDPSRFIKVIDPHNADRDGFKPGQIVPREEFENEVRKLKREGFVPPEGEAPEPASGPATYETITLLPAIQFTVPLLLLALALWLSWRLVNMPTFADFLIATEAELNKVSWTTQRRLIQDTIVVLATVLLMAVYLFGMDQVWRVVLSWKPIGVIQLPEDQSEANTSVEQKNW